LIIYSPHNEQIRYEVAKAFNANRASKGESPIVFDWRSSGGTTDLRKEVVDRFSKLGREKRDAEGIGADLFFGGGDFEHNILASGVEVDSGGEEKRRVQITVPIPIPEGLLKEAFPEPAIAGVPLYHPKMQWVGVVLSSFGIIYNNDYLQMINRPVPSTWKDLAADEFSQAIALADPGHSGSIAAAYHTMLQQYGWEDGWATFRRIAANSRYFTASAGKVAVDVSSGEAAAGMCIDYFGRFQVGAIGGDRLGYIDPPKVTSITPDPISILRGAPHQKLAEEFCTWLLTKDAQRLWNRKLGTPYGPVKYELRRMSVRQDLFTEQELEYCTDKVDPFAVAYPVPPGTPNYFRLVAPISHAIAIDIHHDLRAAWDAIKASPNHPRRQEMLELFDRMPEDLVIPWPTPECRHEWRAILENKSDPRNAELVKAMRGFARDFSDRYRNDPDALTKDRLRWTLFFRDNYRQVVRIASST
jgi:hypothetical protein